MSVLLYESRDNIATITINRAEKRNPLSHEVCVQLRDAWRTGCLEGNAQAQSTTIAGVA